MKRNLQIQVLIAILASGMMFSSCGDVDIVKRKYRPGFHVDVSKKRQKTKTVEQSSVADSRKTKKLRSIETKRPEPISTVEDNSLAATTKTVEPVKTQKAESKRGALMSIPDFKNLSFERKMKTIKNEIFKPKPRGNTSWMKWVAFGAGIAAMAFGIMALITAFFAWSYFIWPAMIFSAAAIVFAILYKNGNGTDPKARLGLIFGIIGGGLAVIALIIWAIWIGLALGAVL